MTESQPGRLRLLLIDELKIVGIAAIVISHLFGGNLPLQYLSINYRDVGLTLFIIASGMGLAYTTPSLTTWGEVAAFYKKRFLRIYPAYWVMVTVMLCIALYSRGMISPHWTALQWFQTYTGFQAFVGDFGGRLSVTFWFVGLIVSLYLLYPAILWAHNRNKHVALAAFFLISVVSTVVVSSWSGVEYPTLWSPLCRVFEFALGIYLISIIDPAKIAYHNAAIIFLADLAFYIYLTHYALIGDMPFFGSLALPVYVVLMFAAAYFLSRIDGYLQAAINRHLLKGESCRPAGQDPEQGRRKRKGNS
jgi:peptidoglycan/LPS O-acetylase OafA/YrhL